MRGVAFVSQVVKQKNELVEDLFYTFAEFFKYPTKEFYKEIVSGEVDRFMNQTLKTLNIVHEVNLQQEVPTFPGLQQQYLNCFSGITKPFAPPIESLYKVWTKDPTAQVSIAKSKGYLMGDCALHMQHLLTQFKIDVPKGYENMPDHLTILLEFCAFLQSQGMNELLQQFINDHLDWLEMFEIELLKLDEESGFYVTITKIIRAVVSPENKWIEERKE